MLGRRISRGSRRGLVSALSVLVALQVASPCWAWGPIGHRVAARLAEQHLNPRAKAAVAALLDPGESLAAASTWADDHRRDIEGSGPWHYVDVPLDQDRYDDRFAGPEPAKGYIVPKIREFRAILKDPNRPIEERRIALRFLIHLIEDLHMPLHVGENHDRGGNDTQVQFFDKGSNLHRVWDSGIIERAEPSEDRWLDDLMAMDKADARARAQAGRVEEWATESLLAAKQAYQDPTTGQRIKSGHKLGEAYQTASLLVVRQRLYQAGVRLAMVLNDLFPES
jgi:nuclease S1